MYKDSLECHLRTVTTHHQGLTIKVNNHPFPHRIKAAIRATHTDRSRHHQVAESICLISNLPRMTNWSSIASSTNNNLCTFIGTFSRHFRKHTIMTNNQCDRTAIRTFTNWDSDISRFPRFDRNPRM